MKQTILKSSIFIILTLFLILSGCSVPQNSEKEDSNNTENVGHAPVAEILLQHNVWYNDSLSPYETRWYFFEAQASNQYNIFWDDLSQGSGKTCDITVSIYHKDKISSYYTYLDKGYNTPKTIEVTAGEKIFIRVQGNYYTDSGTFSLKFFNSTAINVSGININPNTLTMNMYESYLLYQEIAPVTAPQNVTWSSSNTAIATVSSNGSVTGKTAGAVTITATSTKDNTKSATCSVAINSGVPSLTDNVWKENETISNGQVKWYAFPGDVTNNYNIYWNDLYEGDGTKTARIQVSAYRADRSTYYFTYKTNGYITPEKIHANATETIYIKVICESPGTFSIKYNNPPIDNVLVTPSSLNINEFEEYPISSSITPSDAIQTVTWSSSNTGVATVSTVVLTTKITAGNAGNATITATSTKNNAKYGSCDLTVSPVPSLTNNSWKDGSIVANQTKWYYFDAAAGMPYCISWNDILQGNSTKSCNIRVSAYRENRTTSYFVDLDNGYTEPRVITAAAAERVYIKVAGYTTSSSGTFAVKYKQTDKNFKAYNLTSSSYYDVPAMLQYEGTYSKVYVEDASLSRVSTALAQSIAAEFDANIYPLIRNKFGTESDINSDGKITIFILDIKDGFSGSGGYVAGYYNSNDLRSKASNANSNECDMIYMDCYPLTAGSSDFYNTVAHEFQHLVNYNQKTLVQSSTQQETWLNEGLSSAAEYVYSVQKGGGHITSKINYYNADPTTLIAQGVGFHTWMGNLENYSSVYLFFQWLRIHAGNNDGIYKEILNTTSSNATAVVSNINSRIASLSASSWKDILRSWYVANAFKNESDIYGYKGEISLVIHPYTYTGNPAFSLYPGENIYISTSGSASMTPAGNIDYAGINTTAKTIDTDNSGGYTGNLLLAYNSRITPATVNSDYENTGQLPSYLADNKFNSGSFSLLMSRAQSSIPDIYKIDVVVDNKTGKIKLPENTGKKTKSMFNR